MSIEIKTATTEPLRQTFDHISARIGKDKTPNRYQEVIYGLQPSFAFHYRPTWDSEHMLYDERRTAIVMRDWETLLDPRQYYYAAYCMARAKQQEAAESNFAFIEKRGFLDSLTAEWTEKIKRFVIPLRHVAWAGNVNNSYIAAYGMGTPIATGATFAMTDNLGVAQYISRIALILDKNDGAGLEAAKKDWLESPMWQPMRKLLEDSFVTKDWFELLLFHNFLLDGIVHPLAFGKFDAAIVKGAGSTFSMLAEFIVDWYAEQRRWVDAVLKVAAAESDENRNRFDGWMRAWFPRVREAAKPLADYALGTEGPASLAAVEADLKARAGKLGLTLEG